MVQDVTGCTFTGVTSHNIIGQNPMLGIFKLNGGLTKTFEMHSGSPVIDAGNNSTCATSDQQGFARPIGAFCDIGAFEFQPNNTTTITSISPEPSLVGQNAIVSVTVTGGGVTPTGTVAITGADSNCTITLSAGAGNCTVSFSSSGSKTIVANYLGDNYEPSSAAKTHLVLYSIKLQSLGSQDGWILESTKGSGVGGYMDATSSTFALGDDPRNRQYRAILSFDTSSLPDHATIRSAILMIEPSGSPIGTNPFSILGSLLVSIKKGYFGHTSGLELADFNAAASASEIGTFGKTPSHGWYSVALTQAGLDQINKVGPTQFRLFFAKPTNANNLADLMKFQSGNLLTTSARPQLMIIYSTP